MNPSLEHLWVYLGSGSILKLHSHRRGWSSLRDCSDLRSCGASVQHPTVPVSEWEMDGRTTFKDCKSPSEIMFYFVTHALCRPSADNTRAAAVVQMHQMHQIRFQWCCRWQREEENRREQLKNTSSLFCPHKPTNGAAWPPCGAVAAFPKLNSNTFKTGV